jgi:hypothetical protein
MAKRYVTRSGLPFVIVVWVRFMQHLDNKNNFRAGRRHIETTHQYITYACLQAQHHSQGTTPPINRGFCVFCSVGSIHAALKEEYISAGPDFLRVVGIQRPPHMNGRADFNAGIIGKTLFFSQTCDQLLTQLGPSCLNCKLGVALTSFAHSRPWSPPQHGHIGTLPSTSSHNLHSPAEGLGWFTNQMLASHKSHGLPQSRCS